MNHEEELIKTFFAPTKRRRYLDFVSKPKTREKFLRELAHFKSLNPRYLLTIRPSKQHPKDIAQILTKRCASLVLGHFRGSPPGRERNATRRSPK
jgi:hypothetical protein